MLAVMLEGWAGAAPTVTASVRAVPLLLQVVFGVTLTVPPAVPAATVMLFVPCPAVISHVEGTDHV